MTARILISDPEFEDGIKLFEQPGFNTKAWDLHKKELPKIGEYVTLIVRSATKVHADLIREAKKQGIMVINTTHKSPKQRTKAIDALQRRVENHGRH